MIETAPIDDSAESKEPVLLALEEVARLAAEKDAEGAIRALLDSGYPNRLIEGRVLADRYSRVPREVRAEAVAEGVAALHDAINKGTPVPRPGGYVLKVADRVCAQEQRLQERQASSDGLLDRDLLDARAPWADTEDAAVRARRRSAALRLARSMLPRLGQQRAQEVMAYLFDAVENGAVDVPSQQIAQDLDMSDDVVRQSLSRGFRRLARLASDEGLDVQAIDLLDDPDFDSDENEVAP
jgi:DNA-directed RNA polymerase specialized sigma24 family protein